MRAWQDSENELTHPLRRAILLEYREELSQGLGSAVAAGTYRTFNEDFSHAQFAETEYAVGPELSKCL